MYTMYKISWDEVMRMSIQLARKMQGKCIWGIPRGGSIVAAIMSFHGCLLVDVLTEAHVIVDDIACSGRTLNELRSPTAVLVVRAKCSYKPSYWVVQLDALDYVLFPWEDEEKIQEQIAQSGFRSRGD